MSSFTSFPVHDDPIAACDRILRSSLVRLIRLVATVIAWGAKFSEHPLFIADRHRNGGQSAFAKVLINRARDLAEDMKVHRMPNADHVVIALLIEPLQSRECYQSRLLLMLSVAIMQRAPRTMQVCRYTLWRIISPTHSLAGYHGFWLGSAIRLLLDLQVSIVAQHYS